eukprot:CAMPEP_0197236190 /NCGR_PEP_ID=MMETSP1429-20130617/3397_1 /TAXON_ID=49237 /ORGANISM="Chaetoceros  sp., Strain UNC1202" /LENGTH=172 /DNA_ID=CAMNT_0042694943 /DNA_START=44 /DNA_END=562 /DNA_ORIENTATION=-
MTDSKSTQSSTSTKTKDNNVRVGVGVLVQHPKTPNRVYAGLRKGSHGAGLLALPGGHLEMMESWEDCAKREVEEETGLIITESPKFAHVTNDPMPSEDKHYVTIFMTAKCSNEADGPVNLEPHKCEGWSSYSWDELQQISRGEREGLSIFGPLQHLLEEAPPIVLDFLGVTK